MSGPIPTSKLWGLVYTRVTLNVSFLVQRTSSSQSHPLSFRGGLSEKKSFPPTRRPRWAFSKPHNSNSQRNYCNLSEDSFKVVQRISGLGLPSIQALETTIFPWLRYFCNKVRHLCSFSNFSKERGADLYFREFAFFETTLLTLFNNRKYGAAFLVIHQPRRSLQHLSGCSLGQEMYCALKFKRGQHFT